MVEKSGWTTLGSSRPRRGKRKPKARMNKAKNTTAAKTPPPKTARTPPPLRVVESSEDETTNESSAKNEPVDLGRQTTDDVSQIKSDETQNASLPAAAMNKTGEAGKMLSEEVTEIENKKSTTPPPQKVDKYTPPQKVNKYIPPSQRGSKFREINDSSAVTPAAVQQSYEEKPEAKPKSILSVDKPKAKVKKSVSLAPSLTIAESAPAPIVEVKPRPQRTRVSGKNPVMISWTPREKMTLEATTKKSSNTLTKASLAAKPFLPKSASMPELHTQPSASRLNPLATPVIHRQQSSLNPHAAPVTPSRLNPVAKEFFASNNNNNSNNTHANLLPLQPHSQPKDNFFGQNMDAARSQQFYPYPYQNGNMPHNRNVFPAMNPRNSYPNHPSRAFGNGFIPQPTAADGEKEVPVSELIRPYRELFAR